MSKGPYFNTLPTYEENVWKLVRLRLPMFIRFFSRFIKRHLSFHDLIPICHAKDKRTYLMQEFVQCVNYIYLIYTIQRNYIRQKLSKL